MEENKFWGSSKNVFNGKGFNIRSDKVMDFKINMAKLKFNIIID